MNRGLVIGEVAVWCDGDFTWGGYCNGNLLTREEQTE